MQRKKRVVGGYEWDMEGQNSKMKDERERRDDNEERGAEKNKGNMSNQSLSTGSSGI